ncbi:type VI secretion protein IcmF/TssM N-terminal domain-containing protein [Azospirillum griseum]|uniref:Type VI secretion system component TssM1 N-terminal domain-containing protein n=1 Tax=Azospirillum griseum TaxID=2496639 RepID=A0A431VLM4_9PROT|nr:type VI secretion system protein [Azospirillum griseum]RTR22921.1 hypothetical protein EJ903_04910 [Azospirillum griseum]
MRPAIDLPFLLQYPLLFSAVLVTLAVSVLSLVVWLFRRSERLAEDAANQSDDDMVAGPKGWRRLRPIDTRALSASFAAAMRGLKAAVPGSGWRYEAPWVLLLGDHGAGKTTLASAIGLNRPFDIDTDPELAAQGCGWHVFERGIVLDPAGSILWGEEGAKGKATEAGWRKLVALLLRNRAERGLDAVVIAIPCTDLIGPDRLDTTALFAKAKKLRARLRELQQQLGLRLPVYLVVTKCDAMLGFASYWKPLAAEHGVEMFGWSNGQTLETGHSPQLVSEAFDIIGRELHRTLIGTAVSTGAISDMAFLFPAEFQKMALPLTRLADALFRADAYQDPHFFRGLYFTGDGSALTGAAAGSAAGEPVRRALPVPLMAQGPGPLIDDAADAPPSVHPIFVTGLFSDKIFREGRIVQPARRSLVVRSRAVRNMQLATVALAVFLALGLRISARMVDAAQQDLAQPLTVIENADRMMSQARLTGDTLNAYKKLRDVAPQILGAFKTVSGRELLVPFMPSSWYSGLADAVKGELVQGFRLVVLDPMRLELINRWKAVQDRYAGPMPPGTGDLAAFQRVRNYLDDLDRVANDITLYRNAKALPVQEFAALVSSLLAIDLGSTLRSDEKLYADVMNAVVVRPLDTDQNLAPSLETLTRLANDADTLTNRNGPMVRPMSTLASALERVELARFAAADGAGAALLDLSQAFQEVQATLADPALRWLFVRHPDQDPLWQRVLPRIRSNLFLGDAAAERVLKIAIDDVDDLRKALLSIRTPVMGPLMVEDESADGLLRLSPALSGLAAALPEILRYDFMADAPVKQPEALGVRGGSIMWMPEPLEKAVRQYRAFEAMEAGPMTRVPETLRPMLQALVAQRLQATMLTAVADSQVIERRGQDFRLTADETGLLREVRQFARASRPMGDLLTAFSRRGFEQGYATVSAIFSQHVLSMMEQADRIAEEGAPYLPVNEFRDWEGTLPLNAEGWQALSDVELAQYLDNTRGRFDWLGTEIAAPLINFALREQMPATLRNDPHVTKWQRILIEQQRYKAGNPGSSLAVLERYIRFDLGDAVKPDNCLVQLAGGPSAFGSGADFFLQRRDSLRRMALAQCQQLAARNTSTDYARLAADFNSLLAGRYPFADYQGADTAEADLDAVTAFLERMTAAEPGIRRGLGHPTPGSASAQALEFLNRMAAVREFLSPFLGATSAAPAGYDVAAEFRVNRPHESGGNQIIDWTMAVGDQRLTRGGEVKSARWSPGLPVSVTLRWAKDAPVVPLSILSPDGTVEADRAITVSFGNRWSLLRLLQAQRPAPADLPKLTDPQPHTLKFSADTATVAVPGQPPGGGAPAAAGGPAVAKPVAGGRTTVFLRVTLSTPNPDGKSKTARVMPVFPYAAPRLDVGGSMGARLSFAPTDGYDDEIYDSGKPTRLVPRKPVVRRASR